ncbi:hypothetical protein [Sphingomonas bacterium]|uniref:hypothetical protein n=1 Tax=Sphingomonas bacterium TaxID=1895847 RepID=UPI0015762A24|nr:hypothetical protein [Sphingomonas bacterium]
MKPEFKIEGQEASSAEYAALMSALLASQAATPTARACTDGDTAPDPLSAIEALFGCQVGAVAASAIARFDALGGTRKDGDRAVYPGVSAFLEAGDPTASVSGPPAGAAPDRYE